MLRLGLLYAFVDCDPYGISNIYRTLKVGSGNAAHINQFFCVPQATFLGVTPADIVEYKLPTHPLKDVDIKRARDAIKNDPFFQEHKSWSKAMNELLKMGVRAEQQALAKWGLNYVIEEYLPRKLSAPEKFLPCVRGRRNKRLRRETIVRVIRAGIRWPASSSTAVRCSSLRIWPPLRSSPRI